ncbi:MAG: acyl-CoA synthetase [Bacteroidia bacterium]|nr:acyl-CoA synthetase [Bacteroidia bacterium]
MNLFPEHIILNGGKTSVAEFLEISPKSELKNFLSEWYSKESFIEVKTSGSTGVPKNIRLEKEFVAASAQRTIQFFQLKEGDRVLHCLPEKYIAGKLMVVRALLGNLDLFLAEPETDFSFLQTEKFRFSAMVPAQVSKILNSEPSPGNWFHNLEQLLIGGSAIPFEIEKQLQNVSTACYSSYAMTETATHIALRKLNGSEKSEFYHCFEDIRVQLSEKGCLQIFMPGLKEHPLQTNDLAELKDKKTFRILGRNDNVIISGGIKYSPEQIEKKLEPFIEIPFLISSLPHESLGEQLVLVLESLPLTPPKEGRLGLPQVSKIENTKIVNQMKNICQQRLTKYEQPRQILFIQHFPETENHKPDRKQLQQNLKNTSAKI